MNQFRGVELVLGNERAGLELEDVESARNLGAHDVAVVPIRGPRPGADQLGRVHRAAVEKGDFPWMRRIGPIEHRDAALIPRLDHDVAARDRNQRAVVGDAVLEIGRASCGERVEITGVAGGWRKKDKKSATPWARTT